MSNVVKAANVANANATAKTKANRAPIFDWAQLDPIFDSAEKAALGFIADKIGGNPIVVGVLQAAAHLAYDLIGKQDTSDVVDLVANEIHQILNASGVPAIAKYFVGYLVDPIAAKIVAFAEAEFNKVFNPVLNATPVTMK